MLKLTDIPNVKMRLDNDGHFRKEYGEKILEVVNDTYNYLVNQTKMVAYLSYGGNSVENLYDVFNEMVDEFLLNYAGTAIWNVMTETGTTYIEPVPFCKVWRNDLFNFMCEKYKP